MCPISLPNNYPTIGVFFSTSLRLFKLPFFHYKWANIYFVSENSGIHEHLAKSRSISVKFTSLPGISPPSVHFLSDNITAVIVIIKCARCLDQITILKYAYFSIAFWMRGVKLSEELCIHILLAFQFLRYIFYICRGCGGGRSPHINIYKIQSFSLF